MRKKRFQARMNVHLNLRIESEHASPVIEAQKYVIFMGSRIATNLTVARKNEPRRTDGRTLGENPSAT